MKSIVGIAVKGIISKDGSVLMVRRSGTKAFNPGIWEVPGGKLEFGETPEEALIREIQEETSLDVTNFKLRYAAPYYLNEDNEFVVLCYTCEPSDISSEVVLSEEHSDYMWASYDQLRDNLQPIVLETFNKYGVLDNIFDIKGDFCG